MGQCQSSAAHVHPLRRPPLGSSASDRPRPARAALDTDVEALLAPGGGLVVTKPREVTVLDSATTAAALTHTQAAHRRVVLDEPGEGSASPLAALPLSPEERAAAERALPPLPLGSGGDSCTEACLTSLPTVHHTEREFQASPVSAEPSSSQLGGGELEGGCSPAAPALTPPSPAAATGAVGAAAVVSEGPAPLPGGEAPVPLAPAGAASPVAAPALLHAPALVDP